MSQKLVFLQSEGDAYFNRNQQVSDVQILATDPLLSEIVELHNNAEGGARKILEIGCGDGSRLAWLKNNLAYDCFGIEPSVKAVAAACSKGVNASVGTADLLPFDDNSFDFVIFGCCLYLCDREDLFRIASEANRVLRSPGWLLILDFFSSVPRANSYHHRPGMNTYKADYRSLFSWHPYYECLTHKVRHRSKLSYTDDQQEWMAVSVLRKIEWKINP